MDTRLMGRRINTARKDLGLTSEKLSELCGINATYLRQLEAGSKMPSLPMFVLLCQTLNVSPSYLLPDVLPKSETGEMDDLLELWNRATPTQLRLISAMLQSALAVLTDVPKV